MIPRSQATRRPDRRSMVATELHAGQQVGAALASSIPRPEQMIWFRPAAPEIAIEWLLRLIPEAEAKLYGVLTELIPAPSMVMPNLACRQIKMATLAKLAGLSGRWVIELLPRLEERDLIRTQGGRGAAKWIWLLRLGVPRLGKASSTELTQKEKSPEPIPGKAPFTRAAPKPGRRVRRHHAGQGREEARRARRHPGPRQDPPPAGGGPGRDRCDDGPVHGPPRHHLAARRRPAQGPAPGLVRRSGRPRRAGRGNLRQARADHRSRRLARARGHRRVQVPVRSRVLLPPDERPARGVLLPDAPLDRAQHQSPRLHLRPGPADRPPHAPHRRPGRPAPLRPPAA